MDPGGGGLGVKAGFSLGEIRKVAWTSGDGFPDSGNGGWLGGRGGPEKGGPWWQGRGRRRGTEFRGFFGGFFLIVGVRGVGGGGGNAGDMPGGMGLETGFSLGCRRTLGGGRDARV